MTPKEIQAKFAQNLQKVKEQYLNTKWSTKADGMDPSEEPEDSTEMEDQMEEMDSQMQSMCWTCEYLQSQINYLAQSFYDYVNYHSQGHLPAAPSVEQMTGAVKALGLDKEYNVQKKTIWAKDKFGQMNVNIK